MPNPAGPHWDDGITRWNDGSLWGPVSAPPPALLTSSESIPLNSTAMEYWEITKQRAQETLPVWVQYLPTFQVAGQGTAELTALAAQTPAQAAITRTVGGVSYTAASAKTLLDDYTDVVKTMKDKEELLDRKRAGLRAHDRAIDQLNKRWYKAVKAGNDPGSEVYEALEGITTEPATPAPGTIEINCRCWSPTFPAAASMPPRSSSNGRSSAWMPASTTVPRSTPAATPSDPSPWARPSKSSPKPPTASPPVPPRHEPS